MVAEDEEDDRAAGLSPADTEEARRCRKARIMMALCLGWVGPVLLILYAPRDGCKGKKYLAWGMSPSNARTNRRRHLADDGGMVW